MTPNLSTAPYALRMDVGYDEKDRPCDIEVLSAAVLDFVEGKTPEQFSQWKAVMNVSYYARPRESFSEREALDLCAKSRCQYLLMEDLS